MSRKISNQFLINYVLMFFISTMIAVFAFLLLDFSGDIVSKNLLKFNYTAESLMKDDYRTIDAAKVANYGGGVQVINSDYEIVYSKGLNTFTADKLTTSEFTDFLTASRSKGIPYSYDIQYNPKGRFWLIVTFPTSIRIDFSIVHNKNAAPRDMQTISGIIIAIIIFYLILLAVSTVIYSKITSISIVNPLKKLRDSAQKLRNGDYSARVDLNLNNEFGELQDVFNDMAERIEQEITLRKRSEENRKRLILDISHDLKNPLASVMGYADLCRSKGALSKNDLDAYLTIIYENSVHANNLIGDLFELSKIESSDYTLDKKKIDICEYLRETMGNAIPLLDKSGFEYMFDIPEKEIPIMIDTSKMDRVFQNLINNTLKYNPSGAKVIIELMETADNIVIIFKDNGVGIPAEVANGVFKPFVRADSRDRPNIEGSGLGLAIVEKIITAHGGKIKLITAEKNGCEFVIGLPIYHG